MDDSATEHAKRVLRSHFETKKKAPVRTPYYLRQLQVLYENDFFEWVVANALKELEGEGYVTSFTKDDIPELGKLRHVKKIKFFANAEAVLSPRELSTMKTHIRNTANLVDEYSNPDRTKVVGRNLEVLVKSQLRILQFQIVGEHTNEYDGVKWTRTNHNLDFIAKRNDLAIGVEVKNTLPIIPPDEINTKVEICAHLGIVPVFAVRWIKPYIDCIRRQWGFSWTFKTQMFPLGYEQFVRNMYKKLSEKNKADVNGHRLEFPVSVRTELPPKAARVFERWVSKVEYDPPRVDPSVKCGTAHMRGKGGKE